MTVYHAKAPPLAIAAAFSHLEGGFESKKIMLTMKKWDWKNEPLINAGKDNDGKYVFCLAANGDNGLYKRALSGAAAMFDFFLNWVDIEYLLYKVKPPGFFNRCALTLSGYFPYMLDEAIYKTVDEIVSQYVALKKERVS